MSGGRDHAERSEVHRANSVQRAPHGAARPDTRLQPERKGQSPPVNTFSQDYPQDMRFVRHPTQCAGQFRACVERP